MTIVRAAGVLLCAVLLAGCGASPGQFREADPTGYDACAAFAYALGSGGTTRSDAMDRAADLGLEAQTSGIRAGVDDRDGGADGAPDIPELSDFETACNSAGFNF